MITKLCRPPKLEQQLGDDMWPHFLQIAEKAHIRQDDHSRMRGWLELREFATEHWAIVIRNLRQTNPDLFDLV